MARLAIVSSYNENCGNASYTHVLKKAFSQYVEVDVIPLDLFLLQKTTKLFRSAADQHIEEIAQRLTGYDYVNIQFEAGLYGSRIGDMRRRIRRLIQAAPNLILTMHRIDVGQLTRRQALGDCIRTRSTRPWREFVSSRMFIDLYRDVINEVRALSKTRNAWIKVHTRRERRVVRDIYGFSNCFDYPLAFLAPEERAAALAQTGREAFLQRYGFAPTDRVIGLFGYISEYKGIETAIQALAYLPDNYKLAFFGSHHPQAIRPNTAFHPYLESLIDLMGEVRDDLYKADMKAARLRRASQAVLRIGRLGADEPRASVRQPIEDRVKFIGGLSDPEFIEALRLCDSVVLPYIEVGQSMSGVVVLGMEAGARMICANNYSFAETRKYFGDVFSSFDIGNFVELAQKIQACAENPQQFVYEAERDRAYNKYNVMYSVREQMARFMGGVEVDA